MFKSIRRHNVEVAPNLHNAQEAAQTRISIQEIKISKSIACVFAGFFLCWIPMWSLSLLNRFYPTPVSRVVPLLVIFFVFLSSSINPLIYAATNNGFRQEFRKMLSCRRQRRQIVPRQKRAGTIVENIELHEHADVCRNVTYMAILKMSANGSIL